MAGLQPLRSFVGQNVARLRSSPCLLVSSVPPPGPSTAASISPDRRQRLHAADAQVHAFVQRNIQLLTLEFNLRSVPCTISSAFPTLENVNEALSLANRAGIKAGGVVVGVGDGAAIDLAKAIADSLFDNVAPINDHNNNPNGSLVLAPCTLAGLWAATSNSPALMLDTKEEKLLPHFSPSWREAITSGAICRRGTVVTMDACPQLSMPLYSPFLPLKRGGASTHTMAHVAAAALTIILDMARSLDDAMNTGTTNNSVVELQQHLEEMKAVATMCSEVLQLASHEANNDNGGERGTDSTTSNHILAQNLLVGTIPRLSPLIEQSTLLAQAPLVSAGTLPQKLANALLPAYFPQCHLVTFLASILPGLCDALSSASSSREETSLVGDVANSIIKCDGSDNGNTINESSLSSWASRVTMEADIPSMSQLAYGTPDVNALVNSLDSYETITANLNGGVSHGSGQNDHWVLEDVLQRSLNR